MIRHSISMSQVPWGEIRNRANQFSQRWQRKLNEERYGFREIAHAQTFCNEFFEIFGQDRINVAFYEKIVKQNRIDCLWPGVLLIEWKSPGGDLREAWKQIVKKYIPNLREDERPLYYMISDFKIFHLVGKDKNLIKTFSLLELSRNVELFDFMINFNMTKRLQSEIDIVRRDLDSKIDNLSSKIEIENKETRDLVIDVIKDTNSRTDNVNKRKVYDKDRTPVTGSIIRNIRKNAVWLLVISWTISLACGLSLSFIIRTNKTSKVSSNWREAISSGPILASDRQLFGYRLPDC